MISNVNKQIAMDIINNLSDKKKNQLKKAMERNFIFTSDTTLNNATLFIYKEGFLLELSGTRTNFNVYVSDNDGELIETRKPNKNKLHLIYKDSFKLNYDIK